ncbi:transcriptional regulator [Rhizobium mongolense]|uniref:Helix-turn-helix protein n=1 Tax=Rhizobium mongolense TaxID=57676 RepID=A0A7W6WH14_9HYPH|nr:transcriptional regulator [Rhizobium mongolense]MBB4277253.1 hypothetical protein [Rhizobium mongolense]
MNTDTGLLQGYLDREQLARELGCTTRTIHTYENLPDGLPSLMLGGKKLYRVEAVRQWIAGRERRPNPRRAAR